MIDGIPSARKRLIENMNKYDVIITSYTLLQKDIEIYKQISFGYTILDEAQHIKNRGTRNAKSVKMIQAAHRLILTGTPIENSLDELWSLMDFLMPGFLSTYDRFVEKYIRVTGAAVSQKYRISPQKSVSVYLAPHEERCAARSAAGLRDRLPLPALRCAAGALQILCRVGTRTNWSNWSSATDSTKCRSMFWRHLPVSNRSAATLRFLPKKKQRWAIRPNTTCSWSFSKRWSKASTRPLSSANTPACSKSCEKILSNAAFRSAYLDGSTKNRLEIVKEFNENAKIPVFLVSLKAGGTGLNLVGADTVIHYDMWWNPAVENQATDRVHRIGQKNSSLLTNSLLLNTIEEKIVEMQRRKKGLVKKVVSCDDEAIAKLTWEDVLELLQT